MSVGAEKQTATGQTKPLGQLAEGPIFVTGQARSGTTWVFDILTSHPAVAGVLESWLFVPGMGVTGLLRHWNDDRLKLAEWGAGRPLGIAQLMGREELIDEVRELSGRLLARSLEPQHRYLVEKTPAPDIDMAATAEIFPDARFVHVVRDGRDVAVSIRAFVRRWEGRQYAFAGRGALARYRGLFAAGVAWRRVMNRVRRVGQQLGDRYLEVSYEELAGEPAAGIRRLFEFCRIPHDDSTIAHARQATDFQRNYKGGEDQFRRGGRVGDWRSRFSALDGLAFEIGSRGRLKAEGYARHRAWWATSGLGLRGRWPN